MLWAGNNIYFYYNNDHCHDGLLVASELFLLCQRHATQATKTAYELEFLAMGKQVRLTLQLSPGVSMYTAFPSITEKQWEATWKRRWLSATPEALHLLNVPKFLASSSSLIKKPKVVGRRSCSYSLQCKYILKYTEVAAICWTCYLRTIVGIVDSHDCVCCVTFKDRNSTITPVLSSTKFKLTETNKDKWKITCWKAA